MKHNLQLLNNYFSIEGLPDVLLISESWTTANDIHLYIPDNYNLISYYCRDNFIRGGVSIFSKKSYTPKTVDIPFCIDKVFECCCCFIKVKKSYIVFIAVYKSPSTSNDLFLTQLDMCLSMIFSKFGHSSIYILGGDLNINFLSVCNDSKLLFDVLGSYGFSINYDSPTRVQGMSKSGIDYLVSTIPCKSHDTTVFHSNISDHYHQVLTVDKQYIGLSNTISVGKIPKRFYSKFNINKFTSTLNSLVYTGIHYYLSFLELFNSFFPAKLVKIKQSASPNHTHVSLFLQDFKNFLRDMHSDLREKNLIPV